MIEIMNERISSEELCNIYGVTKRTLYNWRKFKNLPMITISPYKRFVRKNELLEWEETYRKV